MVFQVIPGQIIVNDRVHLGDGPLGPAPGAGGLVIDLLPGRLSARDNGVGGFLPVFCLALDFGHRRRIVTGLRVGSLRTFHTLFCHINPSFLGTAPVGTAGLGPKSAWVFRADGAVRCKDALTAAVRTAGPESSFPGEPGSIPGEDWELKKQAQNQSQVSAYLLYELSRAQLSPALECADV